MIYKQDPIIIPRGIRYLSDWFEFKFFKLPMKCIINKQIPGCGFTEYCLTGPENVILCSPRKILLENKWDQHKNEVYLVVNELDKEKDIDKDLSGKAISKGSKFVATLEEKIDPNIRKTDIYNRLMREIKDYIAFRKFYNAPYKILVTYDSYRIVQDILIALDVFKGSYTVVDEFQSILHDSRFKSSTEIEFLSYLKKSHSAIFVSATPMLDEYLNMLSEFDGLPYLTLDWYSDDPSRVVKPSIKPLTMKSVGTKAEEIINTYLKGDFERAVRIVNGYPREIISDEAVLYVNSVNHIISIIKKCGLTPEQCNILCSSTEANKKKILRKLGKGFSIGKVPEKGEKPKMFTFCTSTVYLGADFYSLCARTFIFSDSNIDSLAVDISDDLPQILGRQRLFENPWKNSANFYYRTTCDFRKVPQEEFDKELLRKKSKTESLLRTYDGALSGDKQDLAENYQKVAVSYNYKDDYVAVNTRGDDGLTPVFNNLVLVNEIRAFKIQQLDYIDRCSVFATIHNNLTPEDKINQEVTKFFNEYKELTLFKQKLKLLCEYGLSKEALNVVLDQIGESDSIKTYYLTLGPQRLRALGYNKTYIERDLGIVTFSWELLRDSIYSEFKEGDKIFLPNLKKKLGDIYSSVNYEANSKANDILDWFEVKEFMSTVTFDDGSKKRIRGYELLKSKRNNLEERLVD